MRASTISLAIALGAVLTASGPSSAASPSGVFAVRGLGAQKCADLVARLASGDSNKEIEILAAWAAGYLSQYNRSTAATYEAMPIVDNAAIARLAASVCRSSPDSIVESVFASIVASFQRGALGEESELIEIKGETGGTTLRTALLRKVQEQLVEGGFLPANAADGQYGPRSRQALKSFQASKGLAQTGIPDPATLILMFARGDDAKDGAGQQ